MAQHKFKGIDESQEIDPRQLRPDTRRFAKRASAFFSTTDGVIAAMASTPILALMLLKIPFATEILILLMWLFYQTYVNPGHHNPEKSGGKIIRWNFPFRVPQFAKAFDGSMTGRRLGPGITFLGKEISTKLEVWSGDSDLRTHMLVLGTTGSGKTEFLLGLVYNALVQNSGFIYTDGKGAVDLFNNVFRLARYLGREDDLVTINFLTSGRDFLDKQKDRTTNTMNPFALGSSGMLIELIIALMDDSGGGGDMWKGRAIAFVAGLTRTLCFLRDRGYLLLDAGKFMEYFELPVIEKLVWDKTITENGHDIKINDAIFDKVLAPLRTFILTLPGYSTANKGNQEQKTTEQHGFITMQLTRLFGDLGYTYGYIFQTTLGEVDMYDVVINRRILVVLLPSLERAPDSLKMLGKLIVGAIKQMMAGCLGNRLEGAVREIVMARPTNADVPFYVVLDEYGYYAVLGFAVAPAQARSLGFPQPEHCSVRMGDGSVKTLGEVVVGDFVRLPNGRSASVSQVLEQGVLPVSRVTLASGRAVESANVHHWPARFGGAQMRLVTMLQLLEAREEGIFTELSRIDATSGELVWDAIEDISFVGLSKTRCLVVDDPLHCYLTDGDVVTHNCITFAAQDFSSLQKASKEEADATWENTNVRIAGRMTGGKGAETFKRLADVTGSAAVYEVSNKEHDAGLVIEGYRSVRDTQVTKVDRLEFGDLAAQENGEFTILVGKKERDGSGGVRIIRARTFFTQVKEAPRDIRINHFIKVEPPRGTGGEQELEILEALEASVGEMLKSGKIKEIFPDDPANMFRNGKPSVLAQVGVYMRQLRLVHRLSLGEAARVALVCMDKEAEVQTAQALKQLEEVKRGAAKAETTELDASVAAVLGAQINDDGAAASGATAAVVDDMASEFDIPDISMADDFQISATPDGLPKGETVERPISDLSSELPAIPAIEDDDESDGEAGGDAGAAAAGGAQSGEAAASGEAGKAGSSSGAGGASGTQLRNLPPSDIGVAPDMPAQAGMRVEQSVGAAIRGFLDDAEFDIPELPSDIQAAPAVLTGQISALTFRSLGEGVEPASNEQSDYLQERLSEVDLMLGIKNDVLEIRRDAQEEVKRLEKATTYVTGAKPEPATLLGVDANIKALLYAAENGANDFS